MKQVISKIGVIALTLSCISLMLAIIPSYVIENKIEKLEKLSYDKGSPVSFEIKGVKLSFSENEKADTHMVKIENLKMKVQKFSINLYVTGALTIFLVI